MSRFIAQGREPSAVVASDWFWTTLVSGAIEPWTARANDQNETMIRSACATASRLTQGRYSVVLEGIIGPWFLDVAKEELRECGVKPSYVVLRPALEICLRRAVERLSEPEHRNALSDEEPIRHMYEQFSGLGDYERHVVGRAELPPEQLAKFIDEKVEAQDFELDF